MFLSISRWSTGRFNVGAAVILLGTLLVARPWPVRAASSRGSSSVEERFEAARHDEPSLIAFLRAMPKGGDLHLHTGGALAAEDGLGEAVKHGLYFDPSSSRFELEAAQGRVPAKQLLTDDALRYQFLNAASLRGAVSGPAGGHDHFFRTFAIFSSAWARTPVSKQLATVAARARLENIQYLEWMESPGGDLLAPLTMAIRGDTTEARLAAVEPLLPEYVRRARQRLDQWDGEIAQLAELPAPITGPQHPLTIRYQISGNRIGSRDRLFAVWAAAMALMRDDSRVVGVNLVAPEDHPVARTDFKSQMRLLSELWTHFDRPNVSLHAGELTPTLAPLEDLNHHIRTSIEVGHARRIGHGSAIAWEDGAEELLRRMAREKIAVEVCPSSADLILGLTGNRHPFRLYQRHGVPIVIGTDDAGVARSNLTLEFVKAVQWWNLSYAEVKALIRNSIEYSFLPGISLFEEHDYRRPSRAFRGLAATGWRPEATAERTFERVLDRSPKAQVQVRLERALTAFEAGG